MAANGKGEGPEHGAANGYISPEDREAIRQRSSELGRELDTAAAQRAGAVRSPDNRKQSAYGEAFKYAADLVVGVGLGGLLGWALDRQFGTAPRWMVLLFILGFAAGLLNVIRAARKAQAASEAQQRAAPSIADNDDDDDGRG